MENKNKNTYALVGFILSFFCCIPALIVSIIGLKKAKELNDGKGLAIAGIIISAIKAVIVVVIAAISVVFSTVMWDTIKDDITTATYCSQATDCSDNGDGTYSCKYTDEYGFEQDIVCEAE